MMDPKDIVSAGADAAEKAEASLGGTRQQAMHRLQIGVGGLAAMMLMIGLAQVVTDRAKQTDATTVPESAEPMESPAPPQPRTDPLADAGVVPDLPPEPTPTPTRQPPVLPEQGTEQGNAGTGQ